MSKILSTVELVWLQRFGQVVRTGIPLRFEEYNLGTDCWYNVYAYSMRKNDLFGVIFTDVTQSKRLENELVQHRDKLQMLVDDQTEQLKRSEQQFRTLIENIPPVITRLDKDFRFLYVSPSSKICPTIKGNAILGKTLREIGGNKSYYPQWEKTIAEVFNSGKGVQLEVQLPSSDGEMGYYDWRVVPEFDCNGQVITVLTLTQDITAKKRLEAEMLRLDRLNIIGEMAAAIGHEVRNRSYNIGKYYKREHLRYIRRSNDFTYDSRLRIL